MEFSIREYIREIKNSVNVRLDMLESLISSKSTDKVEILISKIQVLEAKIDELIKSGILYCKYETEYKGITLPYEQNSTARQFT